MWNVNNSPWHEHLSLPFHSSLPMSLKFTIFIHLSVFLYLWLELRIVGISINFQVIKPYKPYRSSCQNTKILKEVAFNIMTETMLFVCLFIYLLAMLSATFCLLFNLSFSSSRSVVQVWFIWRRQWWAELPMLRCGELSRTHYCVWHAQPPYSGLLFVLSIIVSTERFSSSIVNQTGRNHSSQSQMTQRIQWAN